MAILDTLLDVEKSLLGVVGDAADTAGDTVSSVVKTAADAVREVIDTIGGAVSGDE